jgi:hypothetical protein
LTDTGSSRGIYYKMILNKDVLYTLCTNVDTLTPPDKWVTNFFETFAPYDTAKRESIFTQKDGKFFSYLQSNDSAKNKTVKKNFWFVDLDSTQVPNMIACFKDSSLSKYPSGLRESLIHHIGTENHPQSIPFLKELYLKSSDSSNIQMAILSALADRNTLEGALAFKELILKETPLSGEDYQISSLFHGFRDSMELAAQLFPELLQLNQYPEYKDEVYGLLASVFAAKKIKPEPYRANLPAILRDANDELKRENNSEENQDDDNNYPDHSYGRNSRYSFSSRNNFPAVNNFYTGPSRSMSYDEDDEFSEKSPTENFATILVKFYGDNGVKTYFSKLQKLKNKELVMNSYLLLLDDSVAVNDSIWKNYSSSREMRATFYAGLKKCSRLDKFDHKYKNQVDMAESLLFNHLKSAKDSIQFIEKKFVVSKRDSGYVYLFKYKPEKNSKWRYAYNYFQPSDSLIVDEATMCDFDAMQKSKSEKQIKEIYKKLSLLGRQRANGYSGNSNAYSEAED